MTELLTLSLSSLGLLTLSPAVEKLQSWRLLLVPPMTVFPSVTTRTKFCCVCQYLTPASTNLFQDCWHVIRRSSYCPPPRWRHWRWLSQTQCPPGQGWRSAATDGRKSSFFQGTQKFLADCSAAFESARSVQGPPSPSEATKHQVLLVGQVHPSPLPMCPRLAASSPVAR